jgi:hypothetical protein
MTDISAIQRIKELDQERAALFEHAKEEALRRANQAVEDLNALGLNYRLVTGAAPAENKSAGKKPQLRITREVGNLPQVRDIVAAREDPSDMAV